MRGCSVERGHSNPCNFHQGNVQLAATLAFVSPASFTISQDQQLRITESYIDLLNRNDLPSVAADIRTVYESLKPVTLLETMIYLRCGRCRKSKESESSGGGSGGGSSQGRRQPPFAPWYCGPCKQALSFCVICRLPVKGILQSCRECGHSGHSECLKDYMSIRRNANMSATTEPFCGSNDTKPWFAPVPPLPDDKKPSTAMVSSSKKRRSQTGATLSPTAEKAFTSGCGGSLSGAGIKVWESEDMLCPTGCGCKCTLIVV